MSNYSNTPSPFIELNAMDLSALLCSRVCHDVISPVGAIVNGLEVLDDKDNVDMHDFAMDLIQKSAKQASARLQFARLAFGAAGSAGSEIDTGDAESVAKGMVDGEKTKITWNITRQYLAKNKVKLLLNMAMIAIAAIPRGGEIVVDGTVTPEATQLKLTATGLNARVQQAVLDIVNNQTPPHCVDAHAIQPHYTKLVAAAAGMDVKIVLEDGVVSIVASLNPVEVAAA